MSEFAQVHEAAAGPGVEARTGGADARTGAGGRSTIPRVPSPGPHQVDRPLLTLQARLVERFRPFSLLQWQLLIFSGHLAFQGSVSAISLLAPLADLCLLSRQ